MNVENLAQGLYHWEWSINGNTIGRGKVIIY